MPNGRPPSANLGSLIVDADGTRHAIVSQGDALEFISGSDRSGYTVSTMSPSAALKVAWFILWRWWFRGTWCGWKLSAWTWTLDTERDEELMERSAKLHRQRYARRGNEA